MSEAETIDNQPKTKRKYIKKSSKPKGYAYQLAETLKLRGQGLTQQQIAEIQGVTQETISKRLVNFEKIFKELPNAEAFREKRAEILSAVQLHALKTISSKLDTATVRDAVYTLDKTAHYERLERGQSTANISTKLQFTSPPITDIALIRTPDK